MDFLLFALCLLVLATVLAIVTNHLRERAAQVHFDLKPNCLLTRHPVFFVTGPRSFFYFKKYWNLYPSFLAEHGYEVYHLRLPWNHRSLRKDRFQQFITQQAKHNRHYHLIMDTSTLVEFENILRTERPEGLQSLTEISSPETAPVIAGLRPFPVPFERIEAKSSSKIQTPRQGLIAIAYDLHRLLVRNLQTPELYVLGAADSKSALANCELLLSRLHNLAEMDYR